MRRREYMVLKKKKPIEYKTETETGKLRRY
jgi:hypothetical protein